MELTLVCSVKLNHYYHKKMFSVKPEKYSSYHGQTFKRYGRPRPILESSTVFMQICAVDETVRQTFWRMVWSSNSVNFVPLGWHMMISLWHNTNNSLHPKPIHSRLHLQ